MSLEAAVDNCPERMYAVDVEAAESIRSEAGMALEAMLALEAVVALEAMVDALSGDGGGG